jgi:hypothetical protein
LRGSRWAALTSMVIWAGVMVLLLALSRHLGAMSALVLTVVTVVAVAPAVRMARRGGQPVRLVLLQPLQRLRGVKARLEPAGQLHARAPLAAGCAALASFPAVILALVAAPSHAPGVRLPSVTDARWQLCCIAIAVVAAVVVLDGWLGPGTCARAVATDGFSASVAGFTVTLAAMPSLLTFGQVGARPAWLWLIAAQFCWPFVGAFLGKGVSERRTRRLSPAGPAGPAGPTR